MQVFVTGGTGTIGDTLVGNLLNANHEVIVITRDKSGKNNSWKDKVTWVEGDVKEKGAWLKSLEGVDAIINLVGENVFDKRWTDKQKEKIYNSRIQPTRNLVDYVKEMDIPPSVFVSVSGADYYPTSKFNIFEEDDEPGDSFLADVTVDWEAPLLELDDTKTRHVIFRMGVAFTRSGNGAEKMFMTHKFFVGGWIGSGDQVYPWIHVDDFTGLLQWGIENHHVRGIYNGNAPEYRTMKELATIGGEVMGRWTWTWAPGFMLKLVLGERANLLLNGRAVSVDKVLEAGYEFKFPEPRKALGDILEDF